mgnify:FL=1
MTPHPGQRVSVPVPITRQDGYGRLCSIGLRRQDGTVLARHTGVCVENTGSDRHPTFINYGPRPTVDQTGAVLVKIDGCGLVVRAHVSELEAA